MADFRRDKKWEVYLPYCQRFYFACPEGMLQPKDIPKEAGLVWATEAGSISIQKSAPHREVQEKERVEMLQRMLFRYIWKNRELQQPHWTEKQLRAMLPAPPLAGEAKEKEDG